MVVRWCFNIIGLLGGALFLIACSNSPNIYDPKQEPVASIENNHLRDAPEIDDEIDDAETSSIDAINPPLSTQAPPVGEGLYEPLLAAPQSVDDGKNNSRGGKNVTRVRRINLVEYSKKQSHAVGDKIYSRRASYYEDGDNCQQYSMPEIAQMVFLNAGGPRRDLLLLDPDGDGFACSWVPIR